MLFEVNNNFMKYRLLIITLPLASFPFRSFAFERNIKGVSGYIVDIISSALIPFLVTLALAWFIWGVVTYIRASDNQEERKKGRQRIVWGIIALFFMIAFIGISAIFTNTLFNQNPILPQLYTND